MPFKNLNLKIMTTILLIIIGLSILFFLIQKNRPEAQSGKNARSVLQSTPKTKISDFLPPSGAVNKLNLPGLTVQGAKFSPQAAYELPPTLSAESSALRSYPKVTQVIKPVQTYAVAKKTLALAPAEKMTPSPVSKSYSKPIQPAQAVPRADTFGN